MVLLLLTGCKISLKNFGLRFLWQMKLKNLSPRSAEQHNFPAEVQKTLKGLYICFLFEDFVQKGF